MQMCGEIAYVKVSVVRKSFGQKWLCGFKSHSRYQTDKEEGVTALFFVVKREAVRGCRAGNVWVDNKHS